MLHGDALFRDIADGNVVNQYCIICEKYRLNKLMIYQKIKNNPAHLRFKGTYFAMPFYVTHAMHLLE